MTHQIPRTVVPRHPQRGAVVADADLEGLGPAVPDVLRQPQEPHQPGDHLAPECRLGLGALHRRHAEVDGRRVDDGHRVRLAEVHRRLVLEKGQAGPAVHLPALLDPGDLGALGAPPAGYLRGRVVAQAADTVVVVPVVAARVLHAPGARAEVELVGDGAAAAGVGAPAAARLAVDQAGVTVAEGRTDARAPRRLQVRRAVAHHCAPVAVLHTHTRAGVMLFYFALLDESRSVFGQSLFECSKLNVNGMSSSVFESLSRKEVRKYE